ncbi:MAG TPA: ribonuclease III [Acidimicrobiales bacterium]|nr:ribonuclease III [Acidimicrobiales bacterium]
MTPDNDTAPPGEATREALAVRLGWSPLDPKLLAQALAHRSWCAEADGEPSNERLEFLGDAVLGLVVTAHIYAEYPDLPEGELAKVRASVVSAPALCEVAAALGVGDALQLGKGEDSSGGRSKPSLLADAMEALIGAVYLDAGMDAASKLVLTLLADRIADAAAGPGGEDYKTRLQELSSQRFDQLPVYVVTDTGPDHAKHFRATVSIAGEERGRGEGRSKKQAEQAAAQMAWQALERRTFGRQGSPNGGRGPTSRGDDTGDHDA